jgi:hypothetical protein
MNDKYFNITQDYLKSVFEYDEINGCLIWKISKGTNKKGSIAGNINKVNKYRVIGLNKNIYYAHRLIYIYFYGNNPDGLIDHINMNRNDNRICNLRIVSAAENRQNTNNPANNTSGKKGVIYHKENKLYHSRITFKNKRISLGYFKYLQDAIDARNNAEKKYFKCRKLD